MELYLISGLVILLMICIHIILNLTKKNDQYEEWILDFYNHSTKILDEMRELDEKQMFEKDDEVGVVFEDLTILVNSLSDKLEYDTSEKEENEQ